MLCKLVLLLLCLTVAVLSFLLYTPLPYGTADTGRTQLIMSIYRVSALMETARELLGHGSFAADIQFWQTPAGEKHLPSASTGDVSAKWYKLNGVPVVLYRPLPARQRSPAIIYIHGGGWSLKSAAAHDHHVYEYAKRSRAVIFSVDYRLAPQHPFPAGLDDCVAVARYVLQHGGRYSVDVTKVGVAGDDAGGNLATAVAIKLRGESGLPPLLFQVLHMPSLQAVSFRSPSAIDNDSPILSAKTMAQFYAIYSGLHGPNIDNFTRAMIDNRHISPEFSKSKFTKHIESKLLPKKYRMPRKRPVPVKKGYDAELFDKIQTLLTNESFSPLMSENLVGLPPAFIQVGEFDTVRDDGLHYARRLAEAKVKVQLHLTPAGFHTDCDLGLSGFLKRAALVKAMDETFIYIKRQFENKS